MNYSEVLSLLPKAPLADKRDRGWEGDPIAAEQVALGEQLGNVSDAAWLDALEQRYGNRDYTGRRIQRRKN